MACDVQYCTRSTVSLQYYSTYSSVRVPLAKVMNRFLRKREGSGRRGTGRRTGARLRIGRAAPLTVLYCTHAYSTAQCNTVHPVRVFFLVFGFFCCTSQCEESFSGRGRGRGEQATPKIEQRVQCSTVPYRMCSPVLHCRWPSTLLSGGVPPALPNTTCMHGSRWSGGEGGGVEWP